MAPTRIGYNAAVLRRGLWLNAGIVLLGMVYFALNGLSFARWADLIILVVLVYYSYKLVRGLAQLLKAPPAVVISDEGIWDASLGARPVPWAAIREIKSVPRKGRLGGGLFLVLDTSKLAFTPGSFGFRVANAIGRAVASAMSARKDGEMALPMTPLIALDMTMDGLLEEIRARPSAAAIPVTQVG